MKKALALILVLLFCATMLTAQSVPTGKYILKSMIINGEDMLETFKEIGEMLGVDFNLDGCYLEIQNAGKFKMVMSLMGEYESEEGTYTISGRTINFTAAYETIIGTLQGNTITMTQKDGEDVTTMVFVK